jgi:hypothetical protein
VAQHGDDALRLGLALAIVVGVARPVAAHPLDIGYLRIEAKDTAVSIVLDVHVNVAAGAIGVDPHAVDAAMLQTRATELAANTYRSAPLETTAGTCAWTTAAAAIHGSTVTLTDRATCPSSMQTVRWSFPWTSKVSSTFQLLAKLRMGDTEQVAIIDKTKPSIEMTGAGAIGFFDFVQTGIEHIGAAPSEWRGPDGPKLPDGIDHILFVLALLLAGGTIKQLIGITSGFTLGHSVTLALSALGIARPPASVIEPLIALSIALVAAEAFTPRYARHRWKVATFFGLIHGFGFAGALNELELSTGNTVKALFGYNLGVELGQLAILLVATPLVLLAHRNECAKLGVTRVAPAIICAVGVFWFFQRTFT